MSMTPECACDSRERDAPTNGNATLRNTELSQQARRGCAGGDRTLAWLHTSHERYMSGPHSSLCSMYMHISPVRVWNVLCTPPAASTAG